MGFGLSPRVVASSNPGLELGNAFGVQLKTPPLALVLLNETSVGASALIETIVVGSLYFAKIEQEIAGL